MREAHEARNDHRLRTREETESHKEVHLLLRVRFCRVAGRKVGTRSHCMDATRELAERLGVQRQAVGREFGSKTLPLGEGQPGLQLDRVDELLLAAVRVDDLLLRDTCSHLLDERQIHKRVCDTSMLQACRDHVVGARTANEPFRYLFLDSKKWILILVLQTRSMTDHSN